MEEVDRLLERGIEFKADLWVELGKAKTSMLDQWVSEMENAINLLDSMGISVEERDLIYLRVNGEDTKRAYAALRLNGYNVTISVPFTLHKVPKV